MNSTPERRQIYVESRTARLATRTIEVWVYTMKIEPSEKADQRREDPEHQLRRGRTHPLRAEAQHEHHRQRRENDQPLHRAHEQGVGARGTGTSRSLY